MSAAQFLSIKIKKIAPDTLSHFGFWFKVSSWFILFIDPHHSLIGYIVDSYPKSQFKPTPHFSNVARWGPIFLIRKKEKRQISSYTMSIDYLSITRSLTTQSLAMKAMSCSLNSYWAYSERWRGLIITRALRRSITSRNNLSS